ncbi:AzlC family ABC transporter permease [Marinobacterium jannaschii]|uniref:AzlC family ABC transporter permease n=1 Tax=Marinobacterium jannaschii TaxID=64970 RepID=UPI0004843D4B|nr:AzlC family ABC transporter permease [Marinobacterium jannaschii]
MQSQSVTAQAFRASLPVMFGYVPLGIAFGVLFSDLGYHWLFATLMGVIIFAGAAQFLAVGLLANQAGLAEVFITTFLLNSRHLFYGISLLNQLEVKGWRRLYVIFGLTDETYSLLTATKVDPGVDRGAFQFNVTAMNQCYWILGCTLGAWLGGQIEFSTAGIEFALPALFMVLVIEQYRSVKHFAPFLLALVCGVTTLLFISRDQMLLISIVLSLSVLLLYKGGERWNPYRTLSQ